MGEDQSRLLEEAQHRMEAVGARLREVRRRLNEVRSARDATPADLAAVVVEALATTESIGALPTSGTQSGRDAKPPDETEGPAGNAPVPAVPTSPPPLVGAGAARTFEEAEAPPRNP